MTKLFKNSKQVLSFVLAFAVLAVSLFTGVVINSEAACDLGTVWYYDGTPASSIADTSAGTSEDPIIIASAAELAYLAKSAGAATNGLYYELGDVDTIIMQPESVATADADSNGVYDIMELNGWEETKAYFENLGDSAKQWVNNSAGTNPFGGKFDGKGVQIYGVFYKNASWTCTGLFPNAKGGAEIKNIAVRNSYFSCNNYAGALVGYWNGAGVSKIENCEVSNCYAYNSNEKNNSGEAQYHASRTGVIVGSVSGGAMQANNIIAYGSVATNANPDKVERFGIWGGLENSNADAIKTDGTGHWFSNMIILDVAPYVDDGNGQANAGKPQLFENVYTTDNLEHMYHEESLYEGYITVVTKDDVKGAAGMTAMDLDWDNVWFANAGIPELRVFHNISDEATAGTNGHTVKCADCDLVSVELAHTYGADSKCTACGAEKICGSGTIEYWDGTRDDTLADNGEDGSAENPIIIDSAEELAKLVRTKAADTQGKNYKIADGIEAIILQPETVIDDADAFMALSSAAEVKQYFEDKIAAGVTPLDWKTQNYNWDGIFDGHFDGNNVEIYGLYSNSDNAALFFMADGGGDTPIGDAVATIYEGGTTFKNFAVKNAYLVTSNRGGAIIGQAYGATTSAGANVHGIINIDSCVVANCYMRQTAPGKIGWSGVVSGDIGTDIVNINNCLVYGNDAWNDGNNCAIALRANGNERFIGEGEDKIRMYNKITNTIALGVAPYNLNNYQNTSHSGANCFENVFTDQPAGTVEMKNTWNTTTTVTFTEEQIKQLTGTTGAEIAAEIGNGLDLTNTWIIGNDGTPALRSYHLGFKVADNGDGTHSESCNCGLVGAAVAHTFDKEAADGICTVCGGDCAHADEDIAWVSNNNSTCLTPDTGHYECTACGLQDVEMENPDFVPGHKFKDVEAIPADCQGSGTIAHKLCEVCGNAFATTAADDEPIENALESTVDPIKDHTPKTDSNGDILYNMNETGHSKTCSVCNQEIDAEGHVGDYTYDADGHNGSCSVCKMATTGKENHTYVDGVCITCPYECPHNDEDIVWVSNNDGACDKADTGHYECSACKLQDVEMENPDFVATEHKWIDDGEPVELGWNATATACKTVAQKCENCGAAGPDREIGHTAGEWQTPWYDRNFVAPCAGEGQHTEILSCVDCMFEIETRTVTDPKTGHAFDEIEAAESTCSMPGNIAHKYCAVCNYSFAADAADDEAYENALEYDEVNLDLDPDNHVWAEYECTATCTDDGVKAHKFCTDCYLFIVDGETTDVTIDWAAFYAWDYEADEPIGIGAKLDAELNYIENETFAEYVAENYPDLGVEVPAYPEDPNNWDAMDAYWTDHDAVCQAIAEVDENWSEAWYAYWGAILEELQTEAYHEALLEAAEAADVDMVAPADPEAHDWEEVEATDPTCEEPGCVAHKLCANCFLAVVDEKEVQIEIDFDAINPENFNSEEEWLEAVKEEVYAAYDEAGILIPAAHKLTEVKEVAATTEKTGTKAHYACSECDKLFADAEGKEEVTAEKLVIAKLVKEGDKASTNDKTEGDNSDKSPATGESVAAVAAVAALMGAAFVLVRKARKA